MTIKLRIRIPNIDSSFDPDNNIFPSNIDSLDFETIEGEFGKKDYFLSSVWALQDRASRAVIYIQSNPAPYYMHENMFVDILIGNKWVNIQEYYERQAGPKSDLWLVHDLIEAREERAASRF